MPKLHALRLLVALMPVGVCALLAGCLTGKPRDESDLRSNGAALPAQVKRAGRDDGDGRLRFPPPATARAGGEHTLGTSVRAGEANDYRIRYRIVDGPPAALASARGAPVDSVTEAVTPVGSDGTGRVHISQPLPAAGTNRIAIEVLKPDPVNPDEFTVISRGETEITWQAPDLGLVVSAPKTVARNQDLFVTYKAAGSDSDGVTLTAQIPPGAELIRSDPKAVVDGADMIWTLPAGKPVSVNAIFRPLDVGELRLTAEARRPDGASARGSATVTVADAKLQVSLEAPRAAMLGDTLPFQATVTNTGNAPAEHVRLQVRLDDGLEVASEAPLEQTVPHLGPGQSRTVALALKARTGGKLSVQASAAADGDLVAAPESATVRVFDARLAVSAHGPARGFVGQEVTWQVAVTNTGDVPLENVVVRATMPAEVRFVAASEGGRKSGRDVVWEVPSLRGRDGRTMSITATCDKLTGRTALTATAKGQLATGNGRAKRNSAKSIESDRPAEAALEIIGMPALQVSLKDSTDPVGIGERTTYTIRVKNAGTVAARKVIVSAETLERELVPGGRPEMLLRPVRGTGRGSKGNIDGNRVVFPPIDSLAPNAEATFVVEVQAIVPGDARFRAEVRSVMLAQPLRAEEPTRILGSELRPPGQ